MIPSVRQSCTPVRLLPLLALLMSSYTRTFACSHERRPITSSQVFTLPARPRGLRIEGSMVCRRVDESAECPQETAVLHETVVYVSKRNKLSIPEYRILLGITSNYFRASELRAPRFPREGRGGAKEIELQQQCCVSVRAYSHSCYYEQAQNC